MYKFLVIGFALSVTGNALAGPTLMKGAPVCQSLNSLYQAAAIVETNNEYRQLPIPDDCVIAGKNLQLISADRNYGGPAAQVSIRSEGSVMQLWTTKNSIR